MPATTTGISVHSGGRVNLGRLMRSPPLQAMPMIPAAISSPETGDAQNTQPLPTAVMSVNASPAPYHHHDGTDSRPGSLRRPLTTTAPAARSTPTSRQTAAPGLASGSPATDASTTASATPVLASITLDSQR